MEKTENREITIDKTLEEMFNSMTRGFESKYVFAGKDGDPYNSQKKFQYGTKEG